MENKFCVRSKKLKGMKRSVSMNDKVKDLVLYGKIKYLRDE